jgi:UMF1 family MFS transporter
VRTLHKWFSAVGLATPEARAWAMYDWACSAFATTILSAMLPIYFHDVAAAELPEHLRSAYWGYTAGIGLAIAALMAPLLGSLADTMGTKKKMLWGFTLLGAVGSGLLYAVVQGDWLLAAALCIVGNIGFAGANIFYDALLPAVADNESMDRVSTAGYALGYIGGGLLLALNLAWVLFPGTFGFPDKGIAVRASFLSVAFWWVWFTRPLMRRVPEPEVPEHLRALGAHPFRVATTRLIATIKKLPKHRDLLLFLISYWFFTDGIGTIIKMATTYGREVGIGSTHLIGALLLVQFVGIPATFAFGALTQRISTKAAIQVTLLVYTGICVLGYYMTEAWHFWLLATLVALVQGGSQALSRSLYATMVPRGQTAEFFAFISVSARFAGILGPLLFGVIAQWTGASRLSILFLVSFFVLGMALLHFVNVERAQKLAEQANDALDSAVNQRGAEHS